MYSKAERKAWGKKMREARQQTIERNRNRFAAAPVRDALEGQAIRALREAEQAKQINGLAGK
jgi:hypothetical protein